MAEGPWQKYQRQSAPGAPATGPGGFPRSGQSGPWEKYAQKREGGGALAGATRLLGHVNRPIMRMADVVTEPIERLTGTDLDEFARGQGVAIADQPAETLPERTAEGVGLAAGMLVPGGAATGAATKAGGTIGGAARTMAEPFLRSPGRAVGTELALGAGAGAGGKVGEQVAEDQGLDPFWGRMAGEFMGGAAPLAAVGAGRMAGRGALKAAEATPVAGALVRMGRASLLPFTEGGAREIAGRRLRGLAGGDEKAREAAGKIGDSVAGLTPAQQTESPSLMALEKEVLRADPDYWERYSADTKQATERLRQYIMEPAGEATPQNAQEYIAGQRAYTKGLIELRVKQAEDAARAQAEKLRPEMKETEASSIYRRELEQALKDVQAQEQELWRAVPDDVTVPTEGARSAFQRLRAGLGKAQHDDMPDEAVRFLDPDRNSAFTEAESAKDMHSLYSKLRQTARNARGGDNPNRNKARLADDLAEAVLADLQSAEDMSGPLGAALNFTRQRHQTFSQGNVGDVLGLKPRGGQAVAPETTLGQTIGRGGAKGAVAADELRRATEGRPDAEAAMRDYMRRRFTEFTSPRGEFRPEKAQDFLRQNSELLDRFPELKREIADAAESGQFASQARREVDQGLREAETAPEARFADARYGREFETLLQGEKDPAQAIRAVRARAKQDPSGQAARGLESAAYDYVTRKALGENGFSAARLRQLLGDKRTRSALRESIGEDGIARLGKVLREAEIIEQANKALPDVGGDIITEGPNRAIRFVLGTLGARAGAQLGAGTSGASLRTAAKTAGMWENLFDKLSYNSAARLVRDAMEDPGLMKSLLLDAGQASNKPKIRRAIGPYVGAEAGQATGEDRVPPEKPQGPWQNYRGEREGRAPSLSGTAQAATRPDTDNVLRQTASAMAERFNVPPNLYERVIEAESGFDPQAESPKGARGISQVMPATAKKPGFGVQPLKHPNDVREQLRFGAQYLGAMLRRYGGDTKRALVAYNWGPGHADKWDGRMENLPAETRNYVRKIAS